ncbi:MAG: EexN family lipoprotein [Woeseiaceae bacterium]
MNLPRATTLLACLAALVACAKEPPPRSVQEFIDNPLILEAALVRCTQNRAETRYDTECVNAREAVKIIEAKEEAQRRAAFEAESKRKREALRRTQRAASEARRRAEEARRRREEAEYLAQFGELPPANDDIEPGSGNEPIAVIPQITNGETRSSDFSPVVPLPTAGSNAPVAEETPVDETPRDLESIRDELRRRNEDES